MCKIPRILYTQLGLTLRQPWEALGEPKYE